MGHGALIGRRDSAAKKDGKAEVMPNFSACVFTVCAIAIAALLGFAAWRDVLTRTIPDSVSVALLAIGLIMRLSQGWNALLISLVVSMSLFILLLPLCSRGLVGGADLKLLSALTAGLSPQSSVHLLLAVTTVGGILAIGYVTAARLLALPALERSDRSERRSALRRIATVEGWRIRRRAPLPYGIAIAIGAVIVVLRQQGV